MSVTKLLIANRGEIAIRIARAASELNIVRADFHGEWNYTISPQRPP